MVFTGAGRGFESRPSHMKKAVDKLLAEIEQSANNLTFIPPEVTNSEVDRLIQDICDIVQNFLGLNIHHPKTKKMEEKNPTTTADRHHEVRPEHIILRDAMAAWKDEAAEGETRSAIVIQVIAKDGELNASSHINGNSVHLAVATEACMDTLTPDNPVGSVLRAAAIRSLTKTGIIAPRQPEANGLPEETQPAQSNPETQNNNKNE